MSIELSDIPYAASAGQFKIATDLLDSNTTVTISVSESGISYESGNKGGDIDANYLGGRNVPVPDAILNKQWLVATHDLKSLAALIPSDMLYWEKQDDWSRDDIDAFERTFGSSNDKYPSERLWDANEEYRKLVAYVHIIDSHMMYVNFYFYDDKIEVSINANCGCFASVARVSLPHLRNDSR